MHLKYSDHQIRLRVQYNLQCLIVLL